MALFLGALLLLYTGFTRCVEQDTCTPVRVDPLEFEHLRRVDAQQVLLKLRAFNQDFYLDLEPDSSFMTPESGADFAHCFYSGRVNADRDSFAALSFCGALRGSFSVGGMEYFISRSSAPGPEAGLGTHIIQRRARAALPGENLSRCGVQPQSHINVSLDKYKHLSDVEQVSERLLRMGRNKRFASVPRYVEVLVVADESMVSFHGDDLKHYVLTLMSVAARLYKHPSILNSINLVVVGFTVLGDTDKGPKVSSNAALTLRNFCSWQKKLNKHSDKHPEYWDTAILFTKQDLCGATTCDTLGMADVGTMCDPKRSCSVIEDDGLPSAFTTAHELGHVFNMPHDNVKACEEVFGKLKDNHMMSPTLIQIDRTRPWSVCSAAIITEFLDRGHGDCLLDQPQRQLSLPDNLPGATYSLHRQCELAFGPGSKPCPYMHPCSKLWCTGKARGQLVCQTRHFPWADGTSCGTGKICYRGTCGEKNNTMHIKVDGQWGKWGPFGDCSRTCGGGVQLAKRECNNPVPENGGKYCYGLRIKYRSCNFRSCPDSGKSFREEQCEVFNGLNLSSNRLGSAVVWVPKYSGVSPKDKCKLICRANGTGYFYVLAPKVVDGTPCSPDTTAVCVQGRCIKAGCDGRLDSNKKFDKCGVCGGDNQGCKKVSGMFTKPAHGYNFVVMLPVGAANIDVRQRGYRGLVSDENYLAVKNRQGQYLLNGNYVVSAVERDLLVKGSLLRYSGTSTSVEILQAVRPLQEAITVEVLSVGKMTPPRVRYSYYISKESKEDKTLRKEEKSHTSHNSVLDNNKVEAKKHVLDKTPMSHWVSGSWDKCSVSCGTGLQKRLVQCQSIEGRPAADCHSTERPLAVRACGDPCPMWDMGPWSACSKTCGRGFKRRSARCITENGLNLPREHCTGRRKPQELDLCNMKPC
ncbi:A disintegrin and metalloproteinase with thrombospondin motifs 15-like [Periophthalmus magnuspinnatus]|uniref:A disintegrin and metalloproteinase with thrombospondin motifs 15-like n=1 Tax=Periophthalmus magnuspinnatus TaxID=409849 RepID=UPI00145B16C2|nr:A disintegrin and metalloproteinase with thrombospondin motifs 15-like [Periophthalmus magnuspinnatus]XP_055082068.1 A disintegrin and metalloproteinase with thrombospondin motifs 15-like [Periophthalmus magnuspinnatus]